MKTLTELNMQNLYERLEIQPNADLAKPVLAPVCCAKVYWSFAIINVGMSQSLQEITLMLR